MYKYIRVLLWTFCFASPIFAQTPGGVDSALTGLTFWTKANTTTPSKLILNGAKVASWVNEKNSYAISQATNANMPDYISTYTPAHNFNYNPSLKFTTANQQKLFNTSNIDNLIGVDGTVFFVCNSRNDGNAMSYKGANNYKAQLKPNWRLQTGTPLNLGTTSDFGVGTTGPNDVTFSDSSARIMVVYGLGAAFNTVMNGKAFSANNINSPTYNPTISDGFYLGANNTSAYWDDAVSEIIIFNTKLNALNKNKVESYLAIKYGITLDSPTNYTFSNNTILWNGINNATFHHNITAIARDDASQLYQKQSKSVKYMGKIEIYNDNTGNTFPTMNSLNNTAIPDLNGLVIGDNGLKDSFMTCFQNNNRTLMEKVWLVRKTMGFNNSVTLKFNKSGFQSTLKSIVIGTEPTFTNPSTQIYNVQDGGSYWYFNYNFADSTFFSFVTDSIKASFTTVPSKCLGANGSATISITPTGGKYFYSWVTSPVQTTQTASNLTSGLQTVAIFQHSNGNCPINFNVSVPNINYSLTTPAVLTHDTCHNNTGSININASGGTGPYLYSITGGLTFQNPSVFNGLISGNYNVVVKDIYGCQNNLQNETINDYNIEPKITYIINQPVCHGDINGSIKITATTGNSPFSYALPSMNMSNTNGYFSPLGANSYKFFIQDSKGCVLDSTIQIFEPLKLKIQAVSEPSCWLDPTGRVIINGLGGTNPYQYFIDRKNYTTKTVYDSLTVGNHLFYIKDSHGCLDSTVVNITQYTPFTLSYEKTDATCIAFNSGYAKVNVNGTNGPFNYKWYQFPNEILLNEKNNLFPQTYTVEVYDINFCRDTIGVPILNLCCSPSLPSAFTPNGDNLNDKFGMLNPPGLKVIRFEIYNRYGQAIFKSIAQNDQWDGTFNGKPVDIGTYFYLVHVICEGKKITKSGSFELIR